MGGNNTKWTKFRGKDYDCYFWNTDNETKASHSHQNTCEFLITIDEVIHNSNGFSENIPENTIIFIRDTDVHSLEKFEGKAIKVLFFGIKKSVLLDTLNYIYDSNFTTYLLNSEYSPSIQISSFQLEELLRDVKPMIREQFSPLYDSTYYKFVLMRILNFFYKSHIKSGSTIPDWLYKAYVEMHLPENFSKGFSRMLELANCSRGHLCFCLKKYYNTNPTDFINDIRLSYIGKELITTTKSVAEISFESGINNIGHMYKLFKKKYGVTPVSYRKKNSINSQIVLDSKKL